MDQEAARAAVALLSKASSNGSEPQFRQCYPLQVDVRGSQLFERLGDGSPDVLGNETGSNLVNDEQFLPRDTRLPDCNTDGVGRLVGLSKIEIAMSTPDSNLDGFNDGARHSSLTAHPSSSDWSGTERQLGLGRKRKPVKKCTSVAKPRDSSAIREGEAGKRVLGHGEVRRRSESAKSKRRDVAAYE